MLTLDSLWIEGHAELGRSSYLTETFYELSETGAVAKTLTPFFLKAHQSRHALPTLRGLIRGHLFLS